MTMEAVLSLGDCHKAVYGHYDVSAPQTGYLWDNESVDVLRLSGKI